jgi:dihydroorotase
VQTAGREIVQVAATLPDISNTKEIDAQGLTLLPGVIDPQVHFREPGVEQKEDLFTASCACARGGVTSFLEMPNTHPLTTTQAALDDVTEYQCLRKDWDVGANESALAIASRQ